MPRFPIVLAAFTFVGPAYAEDKPAEVKVQKAAAIEKLTKAGQLKPTSVETADLLVYTSWPEPKAKVLAAAVQKTYDLAYKTLKFEPKDPVWPGKLTVFFVPERKEYNAFIRLVEQRKPDTGDTTSVQVRSKEPYILVGLESDSKFSDADMAGEVGAAVAEALLNTKSGVTAGAAMLPTWITTGFAKLMVLKMDGNSAKVGAYRTKVKALFAKGKAAILADNRNLNLVETTVAGAPALELQLTPQEIKERQDYAVSQNIVILRNRLNSPELAVSEPQVLQYLGTLFRTHSSTASSATRERAMVAPGERSPNLASGYWRATTSQNACRASLASFSCGGVVLFSICEVEKG